MVIANKKDGGDRFCVDYRALNKMRKGDKFSMPNIERLSTSSRMVESIAAFLDMFAGYWKAHLAEHLQEMTTFRCMYGSFKLNVRTFGLMNEPACFQRKASELFEDLPFVSVHMDDVVVHSHNTDEHLHHLLLVMEWVRNVGLK